MAVASIAKEQTHILGALRAMSRNLQSQEAVVRGDGGVDALIACLQNGSEENVELSVGALCDLVAVPANHSAVIDAGAVPALVEVARNGTSAQRALAASALASLSKNEANTVKMASEGVIDVLLARFRELEGIMQQVPPNLTTTNPLLQQEKGSLSTSESGCDGSMKKATAQFLEKLLRGINDKRAVIKAGGAQFLFSMLDDRDDGDDVKTEVLKALAALPRERDLSIQSQVQEFIPRMIQLVSSGGDSVRAAAALALNSIALFDITDNYHIAKAGGIPLLIELLKAVADDDHKIAAATALNTLALNCRIADSAAESIPEFLQYVRSSNVKLKACVLNILSAISSEPGGAVNLVRAGGVPILLESLPAEAVAGKTEYSNPLHEAILWAVSCLEEVASREDARAEISADALADCLIAIIRHDDAVRCSKAVRLAENLSKDRDMAEKIIAAGGIDVLKRREKDSIQRSNHAVIALVCKLESLVQPPPAKRIKTEHSHN